MATSFQPWEGGARVALNISAPTQIMTGQGKCYRVNVITAPTAAGGVYDTVNADTAAATANQLAVIPTAATDGTVNVMMQFYNGLYINPGTDGVVVVSYDPF